MNDGSRRVIRALGITVAIAGSIASVASFKIDHMTAGLWRLMGIGVLASISIGAALVYVTRRRRSVSHR